MDHFTLALTTGAVAGALDIIPMIAQKLSFRSCLSHVVLNQALSMLWRN